MMEEVSVRMPYEAHDMDQMSEEEILACLVAETEPKFTVPTKKAKLKESRLQLMDDEEEDRLDKYLKENCRLQQTSLRLEQENDNLAHRLITSKVALKNALDKAEDRVDELTEELLHISHRLRATEEERRGKEEEADMLKQVLRRELQKAEQEVRRSAGITADYKQICSQLTNRLERQQAAHIEELNSLKEAVTVCPRCRQLIDTDEPPTGAQDSVAEGSGVMGPRQMEEGLKKPEQGRDEQEKESLRAQIQELEQDLAQTKLEMVEAKCKIQELEHQRGVLTNNLQAAKNSWISKAFTSLRSSAGGGLHTVSMLTDGAHTLSWNLHGATLSGWSTKKPLWPHKENGENVS